MPRVTSQSVGEILEHHVKESQRACKANEEILKIARDAIKKVASPNHAETLAKIEQTWAIAVRIDKLVGNFVVDLDQLLEELQEATECNTHEAGQASRLKSFLQGE